MANRVGRYGTYNQTVGVRLDMDDAIEILTPTDVPLQRSIGSEGTHQIKVEWLEEDLMAQSFTVDSVSGTASPWVITTTAGGASEARPGDIFWKRGADYDTQYLVTVVDSDNELVTVVSHAGSTDADDPAAADVLELIGQYRTEGSDPEEGRSNERTAVYNYTQIGQEAVEATRTARKRGAAGGLYGQGDPYDHEVGKKFKELAIRFERSMVLGYRSANGDLSKRFMGGLLFYIADNTVSGVKANAGTLINDLLRKCYDDGGAPETLMVSPSLKRAISDNIDPDLRRTTRTEKTGGFVIDHFMSDFGEVDIVMNRHFPSTKGVALEKRFIKRRVFDGYFHELLSKTGDAEQGEIVGEFSLEVKNEQAHGVLTITDA